MIQRIQTLFLLAAALFSGMMMTGDILLLDDGSGSVMSMGFMGLSDTRGAVQQSLLPLTVLLVSVTLLELVSVFLFRKRALQMRLTMTALLLSAGTLFLIAFYVWMLDRKIDITVIWKARIVFPAVSAILCWLAYRGILKDDLTVKSYDRLR